MGEFVVSDRLHDRRIKCQTELGQKWLIPLRSSISQLAHRVQLYRYSISFDRWTWQLENFHSSLLIIRDTNNNFNNNNFSEGKKKKHQFKNLLTTTYSLFGALLMDGKCTSIWNNLYHFASECWKINRCIRGDCAYVLEPRFRGCRD